MNILRFPKIFGLGERSRVGSVGLQRIPDDLAFARQLADAMAKRMDPEWRDLVANERGKRIAILLKWPCAAPSKAGRDSGGSLVVDEQAELRQQVAQHMLAYRVNPLHGRFKLTIAALPPDNRCSDIANLGKQIEDALQHAGLLADPTQIDEIHLMRMASGSPGTIEVTIEEA